MAYFAGMALLFGTGAGVWLAARGARARALPDWRGEVALLADATLAVCLLLVICTGLGIAGLLYAPAVTAVALLLGALAYRRLPRPVAHPPAVAWPGVVVAVAAALVATQWLAGTASGLAHGMTALDVLWYHGPFAAEFAQSHSITALSPPQADSINTFYPANSSMLHALGMLAVGDDFISPLMNLGWLALAGLAAWCAGAAAGRAPLALLAMLAVAGAPVLVATQPGNAVNDIVPLALLAAAVAILLHGRGQLVPALLACAAAGAAAGTKPSAIAPSLVLGVVAVATCVRRRPALLGGAAAFLALCAVWFVRNLAHAGNPLPPLELSLGPLELDSPVHLAGGNAPLVGWLGRDRFLTDMVPLGLRRNLGVLWWAELALAAIGVALALARPRAAVHRPLALGVVVMVAVYALTPQTGAQFDITVRYLQPALMVALLLAVLCAPAGRAQVALLAALGGVVTAGTVDRGPFPFEAPAVVAGVLATVVLCLLAAAIVRRRRPAALAAAALVTVAGWPVHAEYLDRRYRAVPDTSEALFALANEPIWRVFAWARDVRDAPVAFSGTVAHYGLYGLDLSNRVDYAGVPAGRGRLAEPETCREWYATLNRLSARYVMVTPPAYPFFGDEERPYARWTAAAPQASEIALGTEPVRVFRLDGPLSAASCPG